MRQFVVATLIAAAALAGCAETDSPGTPKGSAAPTSALPTSSASPTRSASAGESTAPSHAARTGTVIMTDESEFGTILFDRTGQAIYLFDKETGKRPRCYGECAVAWPPVLTEDLPRGTRDVRSGLLGSTRRADGSTQVTYAGHPLYFYAHEGKNEVLCHNVSEFGGLWLVVTPNGEPAP